MVESLRRKAAVWNNLHPWQVMILAAGRSTRLGSLGMALPKRLLPVCGYPAVTYALALCRQAGLHDVVIKPAPPRRQARQGLGRRPRKFGVNLRYSVRGRAPRTGGGVGKARRALCIRTGAYHQRQSPAEVRSACGHRGPRPGARGTMATMVLRTDPHPDCGAAIGVGCERPE